MMVMKQSKPLQHILTTHRNWLALHVVYIFVLIWTFVGWGVIGAMYFATKFPQLWANIGFVLYGACIISLPALVIHIRARFTYDGVWQWRWSIIAQLVYYTLSIIVIVIVMLCMMYV